VVQGASEIGVFVTNALGLTGNNSDPNTYKGKDNKDGTVTITDNGTGMPGVDGSQNVLTKYGGYLSDQNGFVYLKTASGQYTYAGINLSQLDSTLTGDTNTGLYGLNGEKSPLTSIGNGLYIDKASNSLYAINSDGQVTATGLSFYNGDLSKNSRGDLNGLVSNPAILGTEAIVNQKITAMSTGNLKLDASVGDDNLVHISINGSDGNDTEVTMSQLAFANPKQVINVNTSGANFKNIEQMVGTAASVFSGGVVGSGLNSLFGAFIGKSSAASGVDFSQPVIIYNDSTGYSVIINPNAGDDGKGEAYFMNPDGTTQADLTQSQLQSLLNGGKAASIRYGDGTLSISDLSNWGVQLSKSKNVLQTLEHTALPIAFSGPSAMPSILQTWSTPGNPSGQSGKIIKLNPFRKK
jgi:hypothetical protein